MAESVGIEIDLLIQELQSRFRILEDWMIEYDSAEDYSGSCSVGIECRTASIYQPPKTVDLRKYVLHELLHIAFAEVRRYENYKERRAAEEMLVQDLCMLMERRKPVTMGLSYRETLQALVAAD